MNMAHRSHYQHENSTSVQSPFHPSGPSKALEASEEEVEKLCTRAEDQAPAAPTAAAKWGPWSLSLAVDWPRLVPVTFVWEPTSLWWGEWGQGFPRPWRVPKSTMVSSEFPVPFPLRGLPAQLCYHTASSVPMCVVPDGFLWT